MTTAMMRAKMAMVRVSTVFSLGSIDRAKELQLACSAGGVPSAAFR